jgi:tetratricopeptide (TPR) repeat protein
MEQERLDRGGAPAGAERAQAVVSVAQYLKAARTQLRNGRIKEAYSVLFAACSAYPDHPLILSYYGWLQAVVDKKSRSGVTFCRRAVTNFTTADQTVAAGVYPVLYLNLGRTLLLSGRKKEALESFDKGLTYDRWHKDLRKEMKSMGIRKRPVFPFLSRSNPLNKFFGKLRGTRAS